MLHTFYIILYFFYISLLELSGGINRALHQSALVNSINFIELGHPYDKVSGIVIIWVSRAYFFEYPYLV